MGVHRLLAGVQGLQIESFIHLLVVFFVEVEIGCLILLETVVEIDEIVRFKKLVVLGLVHGSIVLLI